MLAPGRLPGLFQDPRIMGAAVANATTALTNGLSAANQKFIFILFILSTRRTIFHKIVEIGWAAGKGHVRMDSDAFCDPSKSAGSAVVCLVDGDRREPLHDRREAWIIAQRVP
jgi:hypothetical protein